MKITNQAQKFARMVRIFVAVGLLLIGKYILHLGMRTMAIIFFTVFSVIYIGQFN